MRRSRPRWWRLVLGAVPAGVALTILSTSWGALRGSHPAYALTLVVVAAVGVLVASRSLAHRTAEADDGPSRRRVRTVLGRGAALLLVAALTAALVWLRPFGADGTALASAGPGAGAVDRTTSFTRIDLAPVGRRAETGLVFYPGARVDPRAYVPLLTRVAEQGYRVVVLKPAFDIAFTDPGGARRVVERYAEVDRWAVGGHSLGGVVAARAAADAGVDGLVLWASFPAQDLSDSGLDVTSVYGTRDGLTTVADVEASRADLPADATFVPVEGAVHAFFGDYGDQPGDGVPTVARAAAQEEIVAATVEALEQLG